MSAPILFSRTATLGAAAATLTLSSIPATANHLLVRVRARSDDNTTTNNALRLRPNADATAAAYDGNTMKFTLSAAGQADDGINLDAWMIGDTTPSDTAAGVFNEHFGIIPRYAAAEIHKYAMMGFGRFDDSDASAANFGTYVGAGQHTQATTIASLEISSQLGNLAADSEITVWGLAETGDAANIARATGSLTVDFTGEEFLDVTLTGGVDNSFTLTNPTLGRVITVLMPIAGASTTITLPSTVEILEENYDNTKAAVMILRCVDEVGPEYLGTLKQVVSAGGTF